MYEYENVSEPTCQDWWWGYQAGSWLMLQVFRSDRGELRVFMGKESHHINACGIWRWTGPIPEPEDKPALSKGTTMIYPCNKCRCEVRVSHPRSWPARKVLCADCSDIGQAIYWPVKCYSEPAEDKHTCAACGKTFSSSAPGSRGGKVFCAWCYSHPSSENENPEDEGEKWGKMLHRIMDDCDMWGMPGPTPKYGSPVWPKTQKAALLFRDEVLKEAKPLRIRVLRKIGELQEEHARLSIGVGESVGFNVEGLSWVVLKAEE